MDGIKIILSSILIILSFFIGYFLGKNNIQKSINKKNYINLEIQKNGIKVNKSNNTIITINGEILIGNKIKLKK